MKTYIDTSYIKKTKHLRVIKQAADFFADNNKMGRDSRLIVIVTPFAKEKAFSKVYAQADMLDKGLFTIALSNQVANELAVLRKRALVILFHELEHCRQFHKGELTYSKKFQHLVWKGQSMKKVHYNFHPHEILADKVGREYAKDFLKVFPTNLKRGGK